MSRLDSELCVMSAASSWDWPGVLEDHFQRTCEAAPVGILVLNPAGGLVFVNQRACVLMGRTQEEVAAGGWTSVIHPDDLSAVMNTWQRNSGGEAERRIEHRFVRPDGSVVWVQTTITPVSTRDGQLEGYVGAVIDLTEQKATEEELRQSRALLARAQEIAGVGVWDLHLETGRAHVSGNIYEMTGVEPATEPLFPALMATVHPDDRDGLAKTLEEATRSGEVTDFTYRIHHAQSGEEHVLRIGVEAQDDGLLLGTIIDLTDQVESERRLARTQEIAHLGSWEWDLASDGATWSDETFRIMGLAPGEIIPSYATYFERVHPDDRVRVEEALGTAVATKDPFSFRHRVLRTDGEERVIEVLGHVISALDGAPIRMIGSVLDVTEQALAESALRRSEERFRRLADGAPVGIYETDLDGACRWVNERWCQITGISAEDALGAGWVAAIHPEDRQGQLVAWRQALREGESFLREFRMVSQEGRVSWVTGRAVALTDSHGAVTGYLGTINDVTERVRGEREQAALRRVATSVAGGAPPRAIFGLVAEEVAEVIGVPTSTVVQFDTEPRVAVVVGGWSENEGAAAPGSRLSLDDTRVLGRVFSAGHAVRSEDPVDFGHLPGGDTHVVSVAATPVWMGRDLWGAIAVAGTSVPLAADTIDRLERFCQLLGLALANADARRQLATLASTDDLTGLPNRRAFQERLAVEVDRARTMGLPLSLVMLDIDRFKEINDSHGHEVGDRVLIECARRLAGLARSGETVARIGGEEFAWIMPEADESGGLAGAERARRCVADEGYPVVGTVTLSAGVCDLQQASTPAELLRFADGALYRAKARGRNTVCRYAPEGAELVAAEE